MAHTSLLHALPTPAVAPEVRCRSHRWLGAVVLAVSAGCGAVPVDPPTGEVAASQAGLTRESAQADAATAAASAERRRHPAPGATSRAPECLSSPITGLGWYDVETGELLRREDCRACEAVCGAIGSRSEGWYSSCDGRLIRWDSCGDNGPPLPGTEGGICAGSGGVRCEAGLVCAFEPLQCGAPGAQGLCQKPLIDFRCAPPNPTVDNRVCGCDGHTYVDACHARAANMSIAAYGPCVEDPPPPPPAAPVCLYVGTRSEGWYDAVTGERIGWAQCGGCEAVCDAIGSRSEGWYSSCDGRLIRWEQCAGLVRTSSGSR